MREAIERLVKVLQWRYEACTELGSYNRADAYEYCVSQLKGVLANETGDTGDSTKCEPHVRESNFKLPGQVGQDENAKNQSPIGGS